MARVMYLNDNSYVIKRDEIRDDTGAAPVGLTARCFLSATKDGLTAIHATIDVSGVVIAGGKLSAVLSGSNIATHVGALLTAAEADSQTLDIYDRVIVAGSYSDYEEVRVQRSRPAGIP